MFILRSLGRCCCLILNNAENVYCEARRLAQLFLLSASLAGGVLSIPSVSRVSEMPYYVLEIL